MRCVLCLQNTLKNDVTLTFTRWFAQHNVRGLILQDYSFTIAVAQYFNLKVHTADFRIHYLNISQNV